jgi:hypothetical protein
MQLVENGFNRSIHVLWLISLFCHSFLSFFTVHDWQITVNKSRFTVNDSLPMFFTFLTFLSFSLVSLERCKKDKVIQEMKCYVLWMKKNPEADDFLFFTFGEKRREKRERVRQL